MSKQSTTEETKSSGTSSDHRPDEAKQAAATTSDQPPKKIEQAPVPTSDPHPEQVQKPRRSLRRFVPVLVLLLAAALLFVITTNWNSWAGRAGSQKTDDAYLRADITPLSTRVSGTVKEVAVEDYQKVKAGDLLVQLKDDDFRAQVEQSEAAVQAAHAALENNSKQKALQESRIAQAQAGVEAAKADIAQAEANIEGSRAEIANTQAGVEATRADVVRTQLERKRQEALVDSASATRQKLEQVTADESRFGAQLDSRKAELSKTQALLSLRLAQAQQARAGLASRESELEAQRRQRGVLDAQEAQLRADLRAKEEAVTVARTNLEYTRILAPSDGIVGERKVRLGQLVNPGTQVISLVENDVWVQANYKETQLTNINKGDSAVITVDTFPGLKLKGHVEEIAPASGSQFALLPPDNATGNFTKIVQRIPVKIVIDRDQRGADRLRSGMSVIAEIDASGRKSETSTARNEQ
ncbi:MAG TPA: HlyD family secretion protein [Blastocatellia bacterium]|nr:HlyD family secretion protein [Blastocatellia bacterium]